MDIKKTITLTEEEYNGLSVRIVNEILRTTKKGYGCKFVSRETGEELCDDGVLGLLSIPLKQIFY